MRGNRDSPRKLPRIWPGGFTSVKPAGPPHRMIWTVPRIWPGEPCFLLAGGASLRGFDAEQLRGKGRVITINDSWRLAPWADIFYFCDGSWWAEQSKLNRVAINQPLCFYDLLGDDRWVTCSLSKALRFDQHPTVRHLQITGEDGLETNPSGLRHGSSAGYQAINLAYHFGVKRIVLLGYDMKPDAQGRTHWHDEPRPKHMAQIMGSAMLPWFKTLVEPLRMAGVEVVNCSEQSALKCWPIRALDSIIVEKTADFQ